MIEGPPTQAPEEAFSRELGEQRKRTEVVGEASLWAVSPTQVEVASN